MNFDTLRNRFEKIRADWADDSEVDFQFKNKQYTTDQFTVVLLDKGEQIYP